MPEYFYYLNHMVKCFYNGMAQLLCCLGNSWSKHAVEIAAFCICCLHNRSAVLCTYPLHFIQQPKVIFQSLYIQVIDFYIFIFVARSVLMHQCKKIQRQVVTCIYTFRRHS